MKALTGLPTSAYLKVAEEAKIQLADLLQLVQHLEAGASPAYLARYRPELSARLSEVQLRLAESRLRDFLDLEDRRITVLTAIRQQNRMTPDLQKKIEETTDRHELEDYYLPFKPKRRTAADDAEERGLAPLARFLWEQEPADADIEAMAATHVKPEAGIATVADALAGARQIVARWLGEDPEIRCGLRPIMHEESELVVCSGDQPVRDDVAQKKSQSLVGFRARAATVPWRQIMAIRRGVRERWLRQQIELPENRAVEYMLGRLIHHANAAFTLQLGDAACQAFHHYIAPSFANEIALALDERCDNEAVQSFQKNLRKLLLAPPAGPMTVIGLETGRRGGWRAAVVGPNGEFLEGAIVYNPEGDRSDGGSADRGHGDEADASAEDEHGAADSGEDSGESTESTAVAEAGAAESSAEPEEAPAAEAPAAEVPVAEAAVAEAPGVETHATEAPVEAASGAAEEGAAPAAEAPTAESQASSEPVGASLETAAEVDNKTAPAASGEAQEARRPGQPGSGNAPAPRPRDERVEVPQKSLAELIAKHQASAIVIGNGPGVRQVEKFIRGEIRQAGVPNVFWIAIHEAGTWIYATSKSARREFPKADPVMRSAISLARRLQDPLAELVKVDPKVLGVGQYHHEVDAKKLRNGLRFAMEESVHQAGTDLNTAQIEQLSLVPGITERVAKRISDYRKEKGPFKRREQLRDVPGLNERIYDQAVGFLRVQGGESPLDTTGIHPNHYPIVEKILAAAGVSFEDAIAKPEALDAVNLEELRSDDLPLEVLKAVAREFRPSVRQPRGVLTPPAAPIALRRIEDLKVGMKVEGVVTNIAKFGAFVDIGADQDGLVHVSQLSDKFVEDPQAAVKVGDRVTVHILALERDGKRISLSMKEPRVQAEHPRPGARRMAAAAAGQGPQQQRANGGQRRKPPRRPDGDRDRDRDRDRAPAHRTFGPDEQSKTREKRENEKLSIDQKLALLTNKFRTKVE